MALEAQERERIVSPNLRLMTELTVYFVMMEERRDQAALNRHLDTETYARNEARLKGLTASEANWTEYEV